MANVSPDEMIPLLNHKVFCEETRKFDTKYDTRTYIGFDTIANIRDKFPIIKNYEPDIEIHLRIADNVKKAFIDFDRTVFTSEDYLPKGHAVELHFFNSMDRFLLDLRAGKGLYGPLSISRFENNHAQIHPGAHRMAMVNTYHDPVMFVLTDYQNKKDLTISKEFGKLYHPRNTDYDWRRGRWALRTMEYNGVFHRSTGNEKRYKDLIDQFNDNDEHSFHRPEWATRIYKYKKNRISVNGVPVCEKVGELWRVCCV